VNRSTRTPTPPAADRRPITTTLHGDTRVDEYAWMRDRDDPTVAGHLEAENEYTDAVTAPTRELEAALYDEIVARIQLTDETVPARRGDCWYFTRTVEGEQYPIFCRRHGSADGPEAVVLDQNELAAGHDFCALGVFDVSRDGTRLAYAVDHAGDERFRLSIRDLTTGTDLDDVVADVAYGSAWSADGSTLYFTRMDAAHRPYQVWRHRVGRPDADVLLFEEPDDRYYLNLDASKSHAFVVVTLESHLTTEVHTLPTDDDDGTFTVVRPRVEGVEYRLEHGGGDFLIVTNAGGATNFEVVAAAVDDPATWRTVVAHRDDVRIERVEVFASHFVTEERQGGSQRLSVYALDGTPVREIAMPDAVGVPALGANYEVDEPTVRVHYTSLVTPPTVFDEDLVSEERVVRKVDPIRGYDAGAFETERLWATAPDGVQIPISLVARRGLPRDGSNPFLLYGYGSYETCIEPTFSPARVSLLQRGVVFAIAHVRGGGEMGRAWYEDGKLGRKRNTFTDFIACAEHLVATGWTSPARLAARGRSAGGLLMGAVTNLRPDLFRAVVAEVPFVDVINTMLDETLPLTVPEWEEWGNPKEREDYEYMVQYSPYDNIEAKDYPTILATGGFNDPRVAYWEPAKWVARLRDRTTSDNPVLLRTEMGAGHMGPSGRYDAWRKEAFAMAFLLDVLGAA